MLRHRFVNRILASLAFALLCFCGSVASAVPAYAATDPFGGINCSHAADSAICKTPTTNPLTGPNGVISKVTTFIAIVAGAVAVIVIAVAGFNFITSNGEAEKIAKARRAIVMAIIGLIVIVAGRFIINFVISRV